MTPGLFFMMLLGMEAPAIFIPVAMICDTILITVGMVTGVIHG